MTSYVHCYCDRCNYDLPDILVVHKDRPDWQRGRINLCGGRIEEGETPLEAAKRELKEEAGYDAYRCEVYGMMKDRDFTIYCVCCESQEFENKNPLPRQGETEKVEWIPLEILLTDERLLPNLQVIIPLMRVGIRDWIIEDCVDSHREKTHKLSITVSTHARN